MKIDEFISIVTVYTNCEETQELIDTARPRFATNYEKQLELDRMQTQLDEQREKIDMVLNIIAKQN